MCWVPSFGRRVQRLKRSQQCQALCAAAMPAVQPLRSQTHTLGAMEDASFFGVLPLTL